MKKLKYAKLRKSHPSRSKSNNCKTIKNTNSIVNHVMLVSNLRIPTKSIGKQNYVKQTVKKLVIQNKMKRSRIY